MAFTNLEEREVPHDAYIKSRTKIATNKGEIKASTTEVIEEVGTRLDIWQSQGSGWVVARVDEHHINVARYNPLVGRSYIKLPKELQNSMKGLINLQNKDK